MGNEKTSISATIKLEKSSIDARIEDCGPKSREAFEGLSAEERNALAADAWALGLEVLCTSYRAPREVEEPRKSTRLSTLPPSTW